MSATQARQHFSDLVNRVQYGRAPVVIEKHGQPVVAVVPYEEISVLRRLRRALASSVVQAVLEESDEQESIEWEAVRKELTAPDE